MTPADGAKILFTGPTGAGKSTAIRTLHRIASPGAIAPAEDGQPQPFDYGEFQPEGAGPLRLYGAPEQGRFDFMWKVMADDAAGLVVLLDHERPDPAADALRYVQTFDTLVRRTGCVVGIGRFALARAPALHLISARLSAAGYRVPVIEVDVRNRPDMLRLMRVLMAPAWLDAGLTAPGPLTAPHLLSN